MIKILIHLIIILSLCSLISFAESGKTVHVNGYTRANGTYVQAHDRSAAGSGSSSTSSTTESGPSYNTPSINNYSPTQYRSNSDSSTSSETTYINTPPQTTTTIIRDSHGKIKRSQHAKNDFKKENPCPSTGLTSGKCTGYVIDHVLPLKRGGKDDPANMQWQTVEDAKSKDIWE